MSLGKSTKVGTKAGRQEGRKGKEGKINERALSNVTCNYCDYGIDSSIFVITESGLHYPQEVHFAF